MNLWDRIVALFHREVADITKPLATAIRRIEAFGQKVESRGVAAKAYAGWAEGEAAKAKRVAENLRKLVA